MTRIPGKVIKGEGDARIQIVSRAVTGEIVFVGRDPTMLSAHKDGAEVDIIVKPRRKK